MDYGQFRYAIANLTANRTLPNSTDYFLDCLHEDAFDPACDYLYEPPFELTAGRVLSAIGIAILIVAALAGNVLVCVAFCHYKRLRTVPNYFIISLAISDIIVAAISMPLWLSFEVTGWQNLPAWVDFLALGKFWECVDILGAVSSIANLTAISLDRLFSILAPLRHRTRMTPVVALIMISFAWAYALVLSLSRVHYFEDYTAVIATFGFFLPLSVIIVSYLAIYIKYWIRSNRQSNLNGDWNLEKTLLIVIGLFVCCWLPFFVTTLLYHYCLSCKFDDVTAKHLRGFTKWMHYLNSCCNPIIYGFCNINFKTAFWALLGSCFASRYSDMDLAPNSRETSNSQAGTLLRHLKSIKRKLSWKRDLEESIVSNAGEVNENSISLAILSMQLKNGQSAEGQEAQALLEDSRPSSKASEDIGLLSDEQVSVHNSSGDETTSNRLKRASSGERSSCELKPREFTNMTYSSTQENELRFSNHNESIHASPKCGAKRRESDPKEEIQSPMRFDTDKDFQSDGSRKSIRNLVSDLPNQEARKSCEDCQIDLIEDVVRVQDEYLCTKNKTISSGYPLYLDQDFGCEKHHDRSPPTCIHVTADIFDITARSWSDSLTQRGKDFLKEENIIDTKESIV